MNVVCYGPFRAASLVWQRSPGSWSLTIAAHAVFELLPNRSLFVARPKPLDPVTDDDERAFVEPWAPPPPRKAHAEVIVVGHAFAPPDKSVTSIVVRLRVGGFEKLLNVHGDSWFTEEGALVALPAGKVSLGWGRAAGAPNAENPVGIPMGARAVADAHGRVLLPNLRPAGSSITSRSDVIAPVGFGPIAPTWPARVASLKRSAVPWDPEGGPQAALSPDFAYSYFNAAPSDQALPAIVGDERIVLENLHPRFPRLVTSLNASTPCVVASMGGVEHNVPVACDTLVIDTDRSLAFLAWRGEIAIAHPQQEGVVFVSAVRLGSTSVATADGALATQSELGATPKK